MLIYFSGFKRLYEEVEKVREYDENEVIETEVLEWYEPDEADQWGLVKRKEKLDRWIANLVIGLNRLDIPTTSSCQGHREGYISWPEVSLNSDGIYEEDFYVLEMLIEEWNEIQEREGKSILWEFVLSGWPRIIPIQRKAPLSELHQAANEFGLWLQSLSREKIKEVRERARLELAKEFEEEEEY